MNGILVDENLPESLVLLLSAYVERVVHVRELGLKSTSDGRIWDCALNEGLAVFTQDHDYVDLVTMADRGRVILWAGGNTRLARLKAEIQAAGPLIAEFLVSEHRLLILGTHS